MYLGICLLLSSAILQATIVDFDSIIAPDHISDSFQNFVTTTSQNRLVVVDIWTTPCPGCQIVDAAITQLSRQYKDQVVFLKVNVKQHFKFFTESSFYPNTRKVNKVPRILIFAHGKKVADFVGGSKAELETKIKTYLAGY